MNEQHLKALKCMVFAQSFVEALDDFGGNRAFKHQLKNKGNAFAKEVDKFLNEYLFKWQYGHVHSELNRRVSGCYRQAGGGKRNGNQ
jgi:TorA maturation chaperone TorD